MFSLIFITLQKFTKPLIVSAGATLLSGGIVLNLLLAHQPRTPQEQLTLENIEAIAEGVDYEANVDGQQGRCKGDGQCFQVDEVFFPGTWYADK